MPNGRTKAPAPVEPADADDAPTRFSRSGYGKDGAGQTVDVEHFEVAMGMVLDKLEDIKGSQADAMEAAVRRGVAAGVKEAMRDEALTVDFWRRGFDELAKHGASGASQWVGKRILTAMVVAVLIWGVTWLVQTGKLK